MCEGGQRDRGDPDPERRRGFTTIRDVGCQNLSQMSICTTYRLVDSKENG